jgi:hypothetical protein
MEWLFLTCHNHWIVCRLVRDDDNPYLAYSPGISAISIQESSEPFRAFLGAILSVVKDVPVESSAYNPISNLILSRKNKMMVQSIRIARGVGLTLAPQ